ncbi:MAG: sensor histidine kinase [Paenibacillaceae bacterium]
MKLFRFNSIQSNIAAAFAFLIVLTAIVISISSYQLSSIAARRTAQEYTTELIKQLNLNIQTYITNMENISMLVMNNRNVREYLTSLNGMNTEEISDFLQSISVSRKDISSIALFGEEGYWVSDRKDVQLNPNITVKMMPWYQDAADADGEIVISSSQVQPIFQEYPWVVSLSREIRGPGGEQTLGILLVDMNFSVLNDIFDQIDLGKRGYVFIVDNNGNIVYHPQQQLIYSKLKEERINEVLEDQSGSFITDEGGQSRMYSIQDTGFGWKIVGVSYLDELVSNKRDMQISFLALGMISLILALGVSFFLSRKLTRPINQLQEHMKEVEKGNFDIQVPVDSTREIGRLARTFNIMVLRIKELMSQVVKEQEFKRKSEISVLQAQINPHFLYNTLDSIVWMAEAKKSEEVVLMTSALARLFRSSISKGRELVSIQTEVEHITNYLTIQQMRYRDKLEFQIDVDPEILQCLTLKILLQPLVENAIYHGIKNKSGIGIITIRGHQDQDEVIFHVIDNGVGMDETTIVRILSNQASSESRGMGVANVHERIQLYFGNAFGLRYESELDVGTSVIIRIPKIGPEIMDRWRAKE